MDLLNARALIAVIAAGVAGTVVNAVAVAIAVSPDRLAFALEPGRYAVAIGLGLVLPYLSQKVERRWFFIIGTLWLTVAASILAKRVFGAGAPWLMVLGFNLVYAVVAIATYQLISPKTVK